MTPEPEDQDKIPVSDPVLEAERRARKERVRQFELNHPAIDQLVPVEVKPGTVLKDVPPAVEAWQKEVSPEDAAEERAEKEVARRKSAAKTG